MESIITKGLLYVLFCFNIGMTCSVLGEYEMAQERLRTRLHSPIGPVLSVLSIPKNRLIGIQNQTKALKKNRMFKLMRVFIGGADIKTFSHYFMKTKLDIMSILVYLEKWCMINFIVW